MAYGRIDILAAVNSESTLALTSAASVKTQGTQTFGVDLPLTGEPGVECRDTKGNALDCLYLQRERSQPVPLR
jgi:hypothetical protein